ncbi:AMP-binding protein [Mycolicibacterium sp.]|uniref:AMP-binding protein n=1 Tax=Mycolicibacterium sp. TaxID=2320850 RepID=UPI0037CA66CE
MFPGMTAVATPDKPAVIMAATGQVVTHRELDDRSNQLARLWREIGLTTGDHVAVFMENHPRYLEVVWAALRSGLYVTTVNSYLSAGEVAYILSDCGARSVVASPATADVLQEALAAAPGVELTLVTDGGAGASRDYEKAVASQPTLPLDDQPAGEFMLYSSGTTGRPKGIERPLSGGSIQDGQMISALLSNVFGFTTDSVYLSPAPIYHAAPLGFSVGVTSLGGTVVMMEKFDALGALRAIEQYKVTCGQFVPTMFSRMLKLPESDRTRYDLSSLRLAVHAAAPCPAGVKAAMMEWWGPVLWEYYAGTELNGFCLCTPQEWLDRPGNVGRPVVGEVHVLDEDGNEQPPGDVGLIYFGDGPAYEYHNDPEKTRGAQDPGGHGWTTLGDVGYLDEDGWLFLTDRKAFMIISGGVNVYPQEAEDVLTMHPKVLDVAVIGVPHEEMGEEVKAVVQLADPSAADAETESELIAYCRQRLAHYKCPRTIDFERELPRLPTGKLYKRQLRDRYWSAHSTDI